MSGTRRIGRSALIYGLQPVLARAASILMLPVYTRFLTADDYGVLQLLATTVEVVSILVVAGATAGVSRFYFKRESQEERNRLLSTAWLLHCGLSVAGGAFVLLTAPLIHRYLLKGSGTVGMVQLAGLNLATGVLAAVPMLRLQISERAISYTTSNLVRLVLQLSMNILFVVWVRMGVNGPLLSTLVTNILVGVVLVTAMLRQTGLRWDSEARNDLVRFGRPARLTAVGSFILNFGDRYFLALYRSTAAVGTYGLAYQFGFYFTQFFASPLVSAWDPIRYQMGNRPREEWEPSYLRIFDLANLLYFTGFVGIAVAIGPAIRILTTPAFYGAAAMVPPIVAAYVAQAWTATFVFQINMAERTKLYTTATWWSIVVVMTLYWLLIPPFGGMGAAWATAISFGVRSFLTYRAAQSVWPVSYDWSIVRRLVPLAVVIAMVSSFVQRFSLIAQIVAGLLIFGVYAAILLRYMVSPTDRRRGTDLLIARFNEQRRRFARGH